MSKNGEPRVLGEGCESQSFLQFLNSMAQGPEEMCLSSKTPEKMGYFDRVTVSLHIL